MPLASESIEEVNDGELANKGDRPIKNQVVSSDGNNTDDFKPSISSEEQSIPQNSLEIGIKSARFVGILENGNEVDIVRNAYVTEDGISFRRKSTRFPLFELTWNRNESKTILISKMDSSSKVTKAMKIYIGIENGRINAHYDFDADGNIAFNVNSNQSVDGHYDCHLLVHTEGALTIGIGWKFYRMLFNEDGVEMKLCENCLV